MIKNLVCLFLSIVYCIGQDTMVHNNALPVVLMHGIASNTNNMNELKMYLISNFNLNVIVPEIGNGVMNSINIPLNIQGDMLCEELNKNTDLVDGFNFIGVSQGGILGRYYTERCDGYKINNLITIVSPHGGVYKKAISNLINMYGPYAQSHYSFSSYWRDPYNYLLYQNLTLLANLNNEVSTPNSFSNKEKISGLNNFVMVYSTVDEIITPPESGKFSTYQINSLNVISFEQTISYETLGLKELLDMNKLYIYETKCKHDEHKDVKCFSNLHEMFLKFCTYETSRFT